LNSIKLTFEKFKVQIVISLLARILLFFIGSGIDFYSWARVGYIKQEYFSHYGVMRQYNYGPLFSEVLSIFWKISEFTQSRIIDTTLFNFPSSYPISVESITIQIGFNFKLLLLIFIFLFDLIILYLLFELFNSRVASFWIINPYSILISSFWLREDSIMIAFILLFVYFYKKDKTGIALVFLSLSLITKHLFIFLPIWLILKNFKKNLIYLSSYILYTASFVPYILSFSNKDIPLSHSLNDIAIYGIFNDVINYRASNQYPLLSLLSFFNIDSYEVWGSIFFYSAILLIGYYSRNQSETNSILIYLLCIVGFTPGFQGNYLLYVLIPLYLYNKNIGFLISAYFSVIIFRVGIYYYGEINDFVIFLNNLNIYPAVLDTFICIFCLFVAVRLSKNTSWDNRSSIHF
tara:strand:- start:357 stop:1571 length:1215 start_codon:yes stop_codon:yes gene_type:complete